MRQFIPILALTAMAALLLLAGCSSITDPTLRLGSYDGGDMTLTFSRAARVAGAIDYTNITVEFASTDGGSTASRGTARITAGVDSNGDGTVDYPVEYNGVFMPENGKFTVQTQRDSGGSVEAFDMTVTRDTQDRLSATATFTNIAGSQYVGSGTLLRYVN